MRLLVTTQKVDQQDDVLGFFHRWLEELSKHFEAVTVICLYEGEHALPANVRVLSLGKESGPSRIKYLRRFFSYAWRYRNEYDAVFVHMNPEYAALLGWWWRLCGKTVALWYTHRQVNMKLWWATMFSSIIFSSTPYSFRLKTSKARFLGHGIAVEEFLPMAQMLRDDAHPLIISVGRITPIKNIDTLIEAAAIIAKRNDLPFQIAFIGAPLTESDREYALRMERLVAQQGLSARVTFTGAVPYARTKEWFGKASLAVNMVPTGGLDKTVIEAAAAGCPTLTSNLAYAEYFPEHSLDLIFRERDAEDLAMKIERFCTAADRAGVRAYVAEIAQRRFPVELVVQKIAAGIAHTEA